MARTATPSKIDKASRYRCWQSHSSPAGDVKRGEVRLGSDPVVTAAPAYFVLDSVLPHEEPSVWQGIVDQDEEREQERQAILEQVARENAVTLTVELVRARDDFVAEYFRGRPALIRKGSVAVADDPVALANAHHFEPVD